MFDFINLKLVILWGFIVVNIITFVLFGVDKYKAKKGKMRIPERRLLYWCVLGPLADMWVCISSATSTKSSVFS